MFVRDLLGTKMEQSYDHLVIDFSEKFVYFSFCLTALKLKVIGLIHVGLLQKSFVVN